MNKTNTNFHGGCHVTVTLEKGEAYPAMVSTKKEFVGPGNVVYTEYDDGSRVVHVDNCTARVHYKGKR